MPSVTKLSKIDDLMERASDALSHTDYFEAERSAASALMMARETRDFDRMGRILLPLQEARRQRLQLAFDARKVYLINEPITDEMKIKPGCHLVQPPQVGAEARRLRLLGIAREIPIAVVCREPVTQTKLWPIVAISPGAAPLRTKIKPPADQKKPDVAWFAAALEALGDSALSDIDPELELDRRIDLLMMQLDAHPDHELLHQALADACRKAQHAPPPPPAPSRQQAVELEDDIDDNTDE